MRLTDEKLELLSEEIIDLLKDQDAIDYETRVQAMHLVAGVIRHDLKIEEDIEQEAEKIIRSYSRNIPKGSPEWQTILDQTKQEIANRRNYVI